MTLRCGVVGLGRGRQFVEAFARIDGCEVAAVCDPDPKALKPFAGLATHAHYESFLDEPMDVVALISPGPVHAEQSLAALDRGLHVLCETPCVYSIDEARAVVEAVERTGLTYMLAENYLWQGWCEALRRTAAEGAFGEIVYAEGDYTHDCRDLMLVDEDDFVPYAERHEHANATRTWRATHLPPIQYCSHTLGPLLRLMGDRVTSAFGLSVTGRAAPDLVETDLETGLFETAGGGIVRLTNGFTVAHPMAFYYNIVGTRGSAKVLRAGETFAVQWSETTGNPPKWQDLPVAFPGRSDGRTDLQAMLEDFVTSVRDDAKPPIDVHQSMDMTLPGIVAHRSGAEGGVKLDVPDSRT